MVADTVPDQHMDSTLLFYSTDSFNFLVFLLRPEVITKENNWSLLVDIEKKSIMKNSPYCSSL